MTAVLGSSHQPRRSGGWIAAFAVVWLCLVATGMALLAQYKGEAGAPAKEAPELWPQGSRITRALDRPTLVMLAHPLCTCTRASLAELQRLVSRVATPLRVVVAFNIPEGVDDDWRQSDLWGLARQVRGAEVIEDAGGAEARTFGGATSGQVLLYDVDGVLRFRGGITASRGHEGPSAGSDRIVALLKGSQAPGDSPVFGCALDEPQPLTGQGGAP